ncbi:hypothetical protein KP509_02G053900 [Ceratopteris richardii]|uniref:BHLH domain-containing protein n=1 Tax=Ceratopteris richardii TaxID=49495 RepID=A0A8T2VD35_CERRI|nr:hypothetical protein KP509_02G053900 [Ceratopteris richardii]KAH7443866.1 hypothetical protein KP509_02G053900 [Ceratopteris richardii]
MNMVSSVYDTKQDLDNENLPKEKSPTKLNDQKRRRVWPFTTSMSSNTETVNFGSNMNDVQVNQSSVCSYRDGSNAEAVRDPSIFHCGIHALDKVRKKDCVSKDNSISDMGDVLCRGMQHRRSSELLNQQSPFPSASETTMNDKAPWGDIKVQNSIPELKRLSPASKNISSERRRRLKLNEKLYCLRALVPSISKMDKASILADAVQYVRELKQKVDNMEEEIASLEEYKMKIVRTPQRHHAAMDGSRKRYAQFSTKSRNLAHHIVHELDVEKMNDALFYIQIHCMKSSGVLLQLARAIEALDVKIVNASSMSKNDHLINTLMIEVHAKRGLDVGDVQRAVITSFAKFGIFFMESSFRSKCSKKESTEIQAFCT